MRIAPVCQVESAIGPIGHSQTDKVGFHTSAIVLVLVEVGHLQYLFVESYMLKTWVVEAAILDDGTGQEQ